MSTPYADHTTLTPPRLAQLQAIARGERPEVNRARLRWYLQQGYLKHGAPDGERPQFQLTDKAWEATGLPRSAVTASPMQAVVIQRYPWRRGAGHE